MKNTLLHIFLTIFTNELILYSNFRMYLFYLLLHHLPEHVLAIYETQVFGLQLSPQD